MIKDYLKERNVSIYALAKNSGVPYSTVNDLANGKTETDNCKVGVLKKLAAALGLSMEEMYDLCTCSECRTVDTECGVPAEISVRNKSYHVQFKYKEIPVELELCKVNRDTSRYISCIAKWRVEGYIREQRMKEPWNIS